MTRTFRRWLVDGSNVVGSRPDGWWRDRPAAFDRLAVELVDFGARTGDDVTVVFDGPGQSSHSGSRVTVEHAAVADDRLVDLVAGDAEPSSLTVVTSDRGLAARVRRAGATVVGAGTFRRLLDDQAAP